MSRLSPLGRGASQGGGAAPAGNQVVALRVAIIGAVLLALFAIVFFRLWYLQVLSGDSLAAAATKNRSRTVAITAPRGDIVDRMGKPIVGNKRAQIVELAPGSLPKIERTTASEYGQALGKWATAIGNWRTEYRRVHKKASPKAIPAAVLVQNPKPTIPTLDDPAYVRQYVDDGTENQLTELRARYKRLASVMGLNSTDLRRRVITSYYLQPYANIPLRKTGSKADVVNYIAENAEEFPGVSTALKYVRSYPYHDAAAQLFGQVGSVPVDSNGVSTIKAYAKLNTAAQVGLNGLEREYDGYLRGTDGKVKATIDAVGNVQGALKDTAPVQGDSLQLTLDRALQERALKSMAYNSEFNPNSHPGAIVAMDPRNGEILAAQSNPSFDPNDFVRGLTDAQYQSFISADSNKPLFNRVTDSGYAAGSTFKPVTAFAALAAGKLTTSETLDDTGKYKVDANLTLSNANDAAFGQVDLRRALVVSSDVFFYTMGARLNDSSEPLQNWASKLGYGRATGIDLPYENPGLIPDRTWRKGLSARERKCRLAHKPPIPLGPQFNVYTAGAEGCGISDMRDWSIGDNINLAIGQGDLQITPLQTAVAYSAIENGGKIVTPHLGKALLDRSGATRQTLQFPSRRSVDLNATGGLETIREGLRGAASEQGGTSQQVFADWPHDKYPIYGKTGTVQRQGKPDQAWYACYVPDPVKPIVVVVTVEDGGYGADTAAPIAGQMLAEWFGQPLKDIQVGNSDTR